jgi:hypothetical protein
MDAFRALLSRTCSPISDPEAQPQQLEDCARSTIPVPFPHPILTLDRGSVLVSRHDDPPSLLPDDLPPAYTLAYPPILPISGSEPSGSESAINTTADGYNLYATVIAVILTIGLLATAVFFSFFNQSRV